MEAEVKANIKLDVIKGDEIPHLLERGEFGAVVELIVKDGNGKITEKRIFKSQSYVRQFLEIYYVMACHRNEIITRSIK